MAKKPELPPLDALPKDRFSVPALHEICGRGFMQPKKVREALAKKHGTTLAYVDAVIEHYYPSHWFES